MDTGQAQTRTLLRRFQYSHTRHCLLPGDVRTGLACRSHMCAWGIASTGRLRSSTCAPVCHHICPCSVRDIIWPCNSEYDMCMCTAGASLQVLANETGIQDHVWMVYWANPTQLMLLHGECMYESSFYKTYGFIYGAQPTLPSGRCHKGRLLFLTSSTAKMVGLALTASTFR